MQVFEDGAGRKWEVVVNIATAKRVLDVCGIDLVGAEAGALVQELYVTPIKVAGAVYAIIKPQLDEQGVAEEAFCESLAGDAVDEMTKALLAELVAFFPGRRGRLLKKALDKVGVVMEKGLNVAETEIDNVDVDKVIRDAVAKTRTSGNSSGKSPDESESTPGP